MFPDGFEILNHAHPEFLAVTGVEVLEVITGEVGALVAISYLAFH